MKNRNKLSKKEGFSLVELLVVITLFAMAVTALSLLSVNAFKYSKNNSLRMRAILQMQEVQNALVVNKNDLWLSILENTEDGDKHFEFISNKYQIADGSSTVDDINVKFEIDNLYRDENGDVVGSGGTVDVRSRKILVTTSWDDGFGSGSTLESEFVVTNWKTPLWKQTTVDDFSGGTFYHTEVSDFGNGRVELQTQELEIRGDWCNPHFTATFYDIPGSASEKTIRAIEGHAFLGTGGLDSGVALTKLTIEGKDPPIVNVEGSYNGYKVYDIYADENYAYLATDDDSKEVVILDISSTPYTEIGYFNAPWSTDGRSIAIDGDVGYLGQGRTLHSFDLTQKTGSRPLYDSETIGIWFSYIPQIEIVGDYAYLALYNDWYELAIVDIANPSNLTTLGKAEVNFQQVEDLEVSEDGNRAYFGTTNAWFTDDFFVLDTSTKTGDIPVVSSFATGDTSVRGITVVDNKAIIVGYNGQEYQVIELDDELNLSKCGGLEVNEGINDVDSVIDSEGNAWAYVLTERANEEFLIILGGESYSSGGDEFYTTGTYESIVFDTGSTNTIYYSIIWDEQLFENTDLRIQMRTGDNPDLSAIEWRGPDGTNSTYFTDPNGEYIPATFQNHRYIQYKVYFSSDKVYTSILDEIKFEYQN